MLEVPELAADDPLSAELDAAYFGLARGDAGAKEAIEAVEGKIRARAVDERRAVEAKVRAARHQERLQETQAAAERAEARALADEGRALLVPMWAQLDAAADEFAKVAARIMGVAIHQVNVSPHAEIVERLRTAVYRRSEGAIQRRLLGDIGRPLPQNRQIEQVEG